MVELDDATKAKVLKQIEFYFSDSNLPKDKFLRQQVEAHPEGYVDLSLIISFQRMRDVLKLGTVRPEDVPDDLVTAVAASLQGSQLMEVHSSGFQVRRKTALPSAKDAARAVDSRSLYVRPFPMAASLDAIVGFFQAAGVALNAVRLRRHQRSRDFKGSVFVEAANVEEAQRVLGLSLEFEGAPLRMERKQAYLARKIAERKAKNQGTGAQDLTLAMLEEMDSDVEIPALTEINKNVQLPVGAAGAAAAAASCEEQPPAKKRKQSEGTAAAGAADAEMADAAAEEPADAAAAAEPEVEQYEAGCILMLTLLGQPAEADPYRLTKMIKEALGPDKIRFVEQQRQQQAAQADEAGADAAAAAEEQQDGQEQVADAQQAGEQPNDEQQQEQQPAAGSRQFMVRFRQPEQAQELLQAFAAAVEAGEPKQVAGCAAELRLVEGEEEAQYYKRAAVQRAAVAKRGESGGGRGGRGGGRGGGFRGGGRGGRGRGGFRGGRGGRGRGHGRH